MAGEDIEDGWADPVPGQIVVTGDGQPYALLIGSCRDTCLVGQKLEYRLSNKAPMKLSRITRTYRREWFILV
jgi:hypothetical protein